MSINSISKMYTACMHAVSITSGVAWVWQSMALATPT